MERKKNVLIINIHGGFPSCFIQKAFNQLKSLNDLYKRSEFYTRAYPSNASAGPSLHDIIMDAPLGSMIDDVYYDWSHVRRASRSIFDIFKSYGYETSLFGIFGLDKRLNPHENLNDFPGEFGTISYQLENLLTPRNLFYINFTDYKYMPFSFFNTVVSWMLKKRIHDIELFIKYPIDVQQEVLKKLLISQFYKKINRQYA